MNPVSCRKRRFLNAAVPVLSVLFLLACNAVLAIVCAETLTRGKLSEGIFFVLSRPRYSRLNIALVFSLSLFLFLLTRRLSLSAFLGSLLMALLALIQYFKVRLRSEAFVLTDLLEAREALGVVGGYDLRLSRLQILALILMFLVPAACLGIRLSRRRLLVRLPESLLAAALFCFCFLQADSFFYTVRIGSYTSYYSKVGLAVGIIGTRPREMPAPEGYTRENVAAALQGAAPDPAPPDILPDVFFIMCESLFDPAKIGGLSIDGEVFPRLSALMREGYGGNLLVSQFGGGTAQTEYEVLTGYRSGDISGGAYMTPGSLREGMRSLPRLFRDCGYDTEGMHPSSGQTYKRKRAYALLGFERSTFREGMSEVTARVGDLPADSWFFPEILRLFRARPDARPYFGFAVTFQNHGGYLYRPAPQAVTVTGPQEPALTEANNYVNGLRLTDGAIGAFADALRDSGRPAVVVLFGDHCPSYSLFGSSPGGGTDGLYRSHTTPLLVWANYDLNFSALPETIPAYRLGAEIANLLGFRGDAYLNSLLPAPALSHTGNLILSGGALTPDPGVWAKEDERLLLLHYDRLAGQGWSLAPGPQ